VEEEFAKKEDLRSLTIYQMYHDPKCWSYLNRLQFYKGLCLFGPIRSDRDVNAVFLFKELRDPTYQLALGKFGGMISIHSMNKAQLPNFVGFTSWKEYLNMIGKRGRRSTGPRSTSSRTPSTSGTAGIVALRATRDGIECSLHL
jgi:hypothetical protein